MGGGEHGMARADDHAVSAVAVGIPMMASERVEIIATNVIRRGTAVTIAGDGHWILLGRC